MDHLAGGHFIFRLIHVDWLAAECAVFCDGAVKLRQLVLDILNKRQTSVVGKTIVPRGDLALLRQIQVDNGFGNGLYSVSEIQVVVWPRQVGEVGGWDILGETAVAVLLTVIIGQRSLLHG